MAASDRINERGSAQIIEMAIVLPVCLAFCAALIVGGLFALDRFVCEETAERILSAAGRELTLPGSELLSDGASDTADIVTVYRAFSVERPYRYLTPVKSESLDRIAGKIEKSVEASALCAASCECTVTAERRLCGYLLRAKIERRIQIGSFAGFALPLSSSVDVCAVSFDNSESVRNTRLITDAVGYLKDRFGKISSVIPDFANEE